MPKHTKSTKSQPLWPANDAVHSLTVFIERGLAARRSRKSPALPRRHTDGELRYQGIAAALGELARAHMEADLALMVLDSLGVTISDLKDAGADPYDLEALDTEL